MFKQSEKSRKIDNHTNEYSLYDIYDDKEQKGHIISFKVDEEGKGEALFTIPKEWENKHQKLAELPRYFYLKEKESGVEFPRAYYVANPNKTEEENKKNSIRIAALMLKVAKTLPLKNFMEVNSAVILGEELTRDSDTANACESLIWGQKFTCEERQKVIQICAELWGEDKKIKMANNLMAVFAWESGGTFKTNAPNMGNSGGTGLIQFMPITAASLLGYGKDVNKITIESVKNYWGNGKTLKRVKEFADMTVLEQLDHVKKYFKPQAGKDLEFVDFYLQVLFPASSGKKNHVVFSKKGEGLDVNDIHFKLRIKAYEQNKGMDADKNGKLFKNEIALSIQKYLTKGKAFKNDCADGSCTLDSSKHDGKVMNSDLLIKEGLEWAENLALTESELKSNPNATYKVKYPHPWEYGKELRAKNTEESLEYMDCTELVCRYLNKIEWSKDIKIIASSDFDNYAISHPDKLIKNTGDPKTGDIFAWNGHAGIVKSYNSATKKIVTIESISEKPYSWHEGIKFDGVVIWTYVKDKNHLADNEDRGKIIKYYTPKKHYSK